MIWASTYDEAQDFWGPPRFSFHPERPGRAECWAHTDMRIVLEIASAVDPRSRSWRREYQQVDVVMPNRPADQIRAGYYDQAIRDFVDSVPRHRSLISDWWTSQYESLEWDRKF